MERRRIPRIQAEQYVEQTVKILSICTLLLNVAVQRKEHVVSLYHVP